MRPADNKDGSGRMGVMSRVTAAGLILAVLPLYAAEKRSVFHKNLPPGITVEGWNKEEGFIESEEKIIFYELYAEKNSSAVYGVIRYVVVVRKKKTDGAFALIPGAENLQLIENMKARHFQLEAKRCWRKLFLGKCRRWREINVLGAERKRQLPIILEILKLHGNKFGEER